MSDSAAKKPRSLLFYALLCACLGIWGYVLYQIAHGLGAAEDSFDDMALASTAEASLTPATRRPGPGIAYSGDFRDPFQRPPGLFAPAVTPAARRPAQPAAPEPLPLSLNGVVDETALLRGEDGSVYVARVGENAGGARILKVERDHVVVRFGGRSHTLKLTQ